MAPPFKVIDEATGKVLQTDAEGRIVESGGETWDGLDVGEGQYMELYKSNAPGSPAERESPGFYKKAGGGNPDPGPGPDPEPNPEPGPVPGGDGMDNPTNETQLRDALQTYANERRVGLIFCKTPIVLNQPIVIRQTANDGTPWGCIGNYTKLEWKGPGGGDMITFRGVKGVSNRGLTFEKFSMFGNGYQSAPAGACLKLDAPEGDPGCIYKFTLRDIFTMYATIGVHLRGAVFEGLMENVHAENHRGDGVKMEHTHTPGEHQGIVSNIMFVHPNLSRNMGAGMRQTYSCNSILGSYVLNADGAIAGPEGIRVVAFSNGENTGEVFANLASNGYGSVVLGNEGSSDGSTHARSFENGQWVSKGKPMKNGMTKINGAFEQGNHMATYGGATGQNYPWVKP